MKYAAKVYYLIPLTALLFSNQFHQKYFILKDYFLILLFPLLIAGIFYSLFNKNTNDNKITITVSDFLIIFIFAIVTFHYFIFKKYLETIISFHHLQFLLLLFISLKFNRFELKTDMSKVIFTFSGIVISIFTVIEKINFPLSRLMLHSTLGNPSYSSGFLLLLFPVMLSMTNKILKATMVIIVAVGIILLGSRIAIIILCLQFIVLLRQNKKLAIILVIICAVMFTIFNFNRMDIKSKSLKRNLVYRIDVLKTAINMLPDNVFFGRGNGYVKYNFHKYYDKLENRRVSYLNTYYLHCDPLEFIIEYGWLFFILCFVVLLLCVLKIDFISVSVISLIIYSLFAFPLHLSGLFPLFMLFVFYLSGSSSIVISFDPFCWLNRIMVIVVLVMFSINFIVAIKFFSIYLNCDITLKKFNTQKRNIEMVNQLKKSFREMPYYYDLAYRYGIVCMRRGLLNESLKVLIYVKELREEKTININIHKVIDMMNQSRE